MAGQIGEVQVTPDRRRIIVFAKRVPRPFRSNPAGKVVVPIADRAAALFRLDPGGRWRGCATCMAADAADGRPAATAPHLPASILATGDRIAAVGHRSDGPFDVVRFTRADGVEELAVVKHKRRYSVARINETLTGIDPAVTIPLRHRMPDGASVTSWLYLPPGERWTRPRTADSGLPLVVLPYPGDVFGDTPPVDQAVNAGRFYDNAQLLVARGYAVLLPSMPLLELSPVHPFRFDEQIAAAIDAAVATGYIDPEQLILWGHSYGAYAAAIVATQTDRFRAIIASSGIYDLGTLPGTLTPWSRISPEQGLPIDARAVWITSGQGRMDVLPWEDPARFVANSPLYRAGRIATPMLMIAADRDAAPLQQAEQMFSALAVQDKDAQLLTYWGEGHAIGSPANVEDMYGRIFAWLETCFGKGGASGVARAR
eukprot:Opistho-1_new@60002